MSPDIIKYIRKHRFLKLHGADIEYTVADEDTVRGIQIELSEDNDQQIGYVDLATRELTSFRGLIEIPSANWLTELNLSHNYLIDPYRDTYDIRSPFIKMTNLQILNLRNNPLERLPSTFFDGLNQLIILNLHANRLVQLSSGLSKLTNLTQLNFGHNLLTNSSLNPLVTLTSLTMLNLNNNQLTQITNQFSLLTNLNDLTLNDNQITHIDTDAFINNTNLISLDLTANPIKLTYEHFSYLTGLQELFISASSINHQNRLLLTQMPELVVMEYTDESGKTIATILINVYKLIKHQSKYKYIY